MNFTTKASGRLSCTKLNASIDVKWLLFMLLYLLFSPSLRSQSVSIAQLANSQYQAGQYDSALANYDRLVNQNPTQKEGYYNRGLCSYHLNKLLYAQRDFTISLQIDSVFDDARFIKIITLQKLGDWNGAYIEFKRMNTTYTGYKELKKRIQYHRLSVSISRNWYYMIAIMFLFIIVVAVAAKSYTMRRGY